jgi:hypothetical protein
VYEEREVLDRTTGAVRKVQVQVGKRPGKVVHPAIPRRDLHLFAMRGDR